MSLLSEELSRRGHAHRESVAAARSTEGLAERALVMFEERIDGGSYETGKARQLIVLTALARLALLVDRRMARPVSACRREGASWADIAKALRVTRQTAHERYRHLAASTD